VSGSGTGTITISGSFQQVVDVLPTLVYINAASGHDTITITANDQADHSAASVSIDMTVRPATNFITLDDPQGTASSANGIDNAGDIIGSFFPFSPLTSEKDGFLFSAGTFTTLDDPAAQGNNEHTVPQGINDSGKITGYAGGTSFGIKFIDNEDVGFVYSGGSFQNVDASAFSSQSDQVFFEGINNNDQIVGYYNTSSNPNNDAGIPPVYTGFIFHNGAVQTLGPTGTTPFGIDDAGEVVGQTGAHGFLYQNGVLSFLDDPFASTTTLRDINNTGVIVGYYESQGVTHGVAYNQSSAIWTTIDVPGATATFVYGVNDSNQIVGAYTDGNGVQHVFVGTIPPPLPAVPGNVDEWLLVNGAWSASAQPGPHPAGARVAAVADFTGDETSDILWQNVNTSAVDLWKMKSGAWAGSVDLGTHPGAGWQIAGAGDFNHDGSSDVLWFNPGTGETDIWELVNGQWAASVQPGPHPLGYQVAGIGDFNRDGTSDVLWFNPTTRDVDEWNIVNGHWAGSNHIGSHPDAGSQIAGVGDFNSDGTSDVFWYNPSTGATDVWLLQNGHWSRSAGPGSHPTGYQVAGIGDFNNDATSDVLFFNPTTGNVDEWKMSNGVWAGSVNLGTHPGSAIIAGVGDFNGSLTSDILWHQFV
jgi:hypothetical protein